MLLWYLSIFVVSLIPNVLMFRRRKCIVVYLVASICMAISTGINNFSLRHFPSISAMGFLIISFSAIVYISRSNIKSIKGMACVGWGRTGLRNVKSKKDRFLLEWIQCNTIVVALFLMYSSIAFLYLIYPYAYTPRALTPESVVVYEDCVSFMQKYPEYENLGFCSAGSFSIEDRFKSMNSTPQRILWQMNFDLEYDDYFKADDINKIKYLSKQLAQNQCYWAQRVGDVVLFVKKKEHIYSPNWPGVAYSIEGRNPNEIDLPVLNANKPFTHLKGQWYMSKKLNIPILRLPFGEQVVPEKSLIDHSHEIPDLLRHK